MNYRKWGHILFIVIVLSVLGVLATHVLFKMPAVNSWLIPEWSAGDALTYVGTILAALIAAGGIYITLQDNRNENAEQQRKAVLPLVGITILGTHYGAALTETIQYEKDRSGNDGNTKHTE